MGFIFYDVHSAIHELSTEFEFLSCYYDFFKESMDLYIYIRNHF